MVVCVGGGADVGIHTLPFLYLPFYTLLLYTLQASMAAGRMPGFHVIARVRYAAAGHRVAVSARFVAALLHGRGGGL